MSIGLIIAQAGPAEQSFSCWTIPLLLLLAFGGAFLVSVILTPLLAKLFSRIGFADQPREDRFAQRSVPKGGGIAIFWAVTIPILVGLFLVRYCHTHAYLPAWLPQGLEDHFAGILAKTSGALAVLAGAAILHVLGLIDDRVGLPPLLKLIVQFAVAIALVAFFDIRLLTVLPWHIGTILTVIWIVLLTNVFNFLDNMDGLSAGTAAIALIVLICVGRISQQIFVPVLATVTVGALVGFLLYNFNPARIFMGDSGSLPLGYLVAVVSLLTTYYDPAIQHGPWYGTLTPLLVLAIPLYDFVSVVFLRLRVGQAPWIGDRRHFSHRLIQRGMGQTKAVLTIYLATATTALSATLLWQVRTLGAILIFAQVLAVTTIIALLESSNHKNHQYNIDKHA